MCKQIIGFVAVAGFTGFLGDGARADSPDAGEARVWLAQAAAPEGTGQGTAGSNKQPEGTDEKKGGDPAQQAGKSAGEAKWQETRWMLDSGEPTYRISEDGTIDWGTYEGYKRYHAECHTCHGPNGMGSTFAPALADSLKSMKYEQFKEIVSSGKTSADKVMPAFASNPNVMCYIDDLYTYLKARADGVLKAGAEAVKERVDKAPATQDAEKQCME
jgi:methanol metabolism-related c-type cytochrome